MRYALEAFAGFVFGYGLATLQWWLLFRRARGALASLARGITRVGTSSIVRDRLGIRRK